MKDFYQLFIKKKKLVHESKRFNLLNIFSEIKKIMPKMKIDFRYDDKLIF